MKAFKRRKRPGSRSGATQPNRLVVVLLMCVIGAAVWIRRDPLTLSTSTTRARATLAIEPFKVLDSQHIEWKPGPFADSLATRLAGVEGLMIKVATADQRPAEFTLRGDVAVRDGRLVVSTRLTHSGEQVPVWSGTFWRSRNSLENFVDDVAAGVAEALYADIVRRELTKAKGGS